MSTDLLSKGKKIRNDLQNAKSQINSIINLLDDNLIVNDVYVQKANIALLNNKLSQMINTVNYSIIPAIDVNSESSS